MTKPLTTDELFKRLGATKIEELKKLSAACRPMSKEDNIDIALDWIKLQITEGILRAMKDKNISRPELVKLSGIPKQTIDRVIRNDDANITLLTVARIAVALDLEVTIDIKPKGPRVYQNEANPGG